MAPKAQHGPLPSDPAFRNRVERATKEWLGPRMREIVLPLVKPYHIQFELHCPLKLCEPSVALVTRVIDGIPVLDLSRKNLYTEEELVLLEASASDPPTFRKALQENMVNPGVQGATINKVEIQGQIGTQQLTTQALVLVAPGFSPVPVKPALLQPSTFKAQVFMAEIEQSIRDYDFI